MSEIRFHGRAPPCTTSLDDRVEGKGLASKMAIGNIGIGNIITLATLFNHLGKKCFAFSSLDKSNIPDILVKM